MADLEYGTLVRHATLGVGRVVAVEVNAVHGWPGGLDASSLDPKPGRWSASWM